MTTTRLYVRVLSAYYFCIFFGSGWMFPLLSVYLSSKLHLSTEQIGIIMAIEPAVAIFVQPLWGITADRTGRPRLLLGIAVSIAACLGLTYGNARNFVTLLIIAFLFSLVICAITPLGDSVAVRFASQQNLSFGGFRLWGSIGYAVAAVIAGKVASMYSFSPSFYMFFIIFLLSLLLIRKLPSERDCEEPLDFRGGLCDLLKQPNYMVFLAAVFLISGPMEANNTFQGLLLQKLGSSTTGVGLAWFLTALIEVPFMRLAGPLIRRYGTLIATVMAASVSALQFITYSVAATPTLIYALSLAQGFAFGVMVTSSLAYVEAQSPSAVKHTAISLYAAVVYGVGNCFFTLIGGWFAHQTSLFVMYRVFGVVSMAGVCLLVWLWWTKYRGVRETNQPL